MWCILTCLTRSRATDPVQVMDEAKDSVSSLQLSRHEILTGYVIVHVASYTDFSFIF